MKPRTSELADIRRYVNNVLHHRIKSPTVAEFKERLRDFERLVLSVLRPKTFKKQAKFDEIIGRAESSGKM